MGLISRFFSFFSKKESKPHSEEEPKPAARSQKISQRKTKSSKIVPAKAIVVDTVSSPEAIIPAPVVETAEIITDISTSNNAETIPPIEKHPLKKEDNPLDTVAPSRSPRSPAPVVAPMRFGNPTPATSSRRRRTSASGKQLGELLIKRGYITQKALDTALEIQEQSGGLLGQILVDNGNCKSHELGVALMSQRTVTTVDLSQAGMDKKAKVHLDPDAISLVDREFCEKHRLMPFEKLGGVLCVAMANVLDTVAPKELRDKTQLQIKKFDTNWLEVRQLIARCYAAPGTIPKEAVDDLEEIDIFLPTSEIDTKKSRIPGSPSSIRIGSQKHRAMQIAKNDASGTTIKAPLRAIPLTEKEAAEFVNHDNVLDYAALWKANLTSDLPQIATIVPDRLAW